MHAELTANDEIKNYTPDSLKQGLIDLHNELLPEYPITEFDADKNLMGSGMFGSADGAEIYFPHREDKEELFEYALEKAQEQENPMDGAIILAASVVAVHPFNDGNGRVSRAIYQRLMGQEVRPEEQREEGANTASRDFIDVGSAFTQNRDLAAYANHYPYLVSGIKQEGMRVVVHKPAVKDEIEATKLTEDSLSGLDEEEQEDLVSAIGADKYGNVYRKDQEGLMFAAASITQKYPELTTHVYTTEGAEQGLINIHNFLPNLSSEQKKEFVSALWGYRKLRAQAAIDFLSEDIGLKTIQTKMGSMSLRSLVMKATNNLHTSKIKDN